jgi:Tfp pilus assembly protein PilO
VRQRLAALSPRAALALAALGLLLYAAGAWFVLVSPKRAEVARLGDEVVAAQARLVAARAAASRPSPASARVPVAEVLQLVKAMPSSADQAGLVLELSALARRSGVTLRSISPGTATVGSGGATMIPVTVSLDGGYFQITRFLRAARGLVAVRGNRVRARGRLLDVQSVELVESQERGFPRLDGTVVLNAYVYDGPLTPAQSTSSTSSSDGTSSGTEAAGRTS